MAIVAGFHILEGGISLPGGTYAQFSFDAILEMARAWNLPLPVPDDGKFATAPPYLIPGTPNGRNRQAVVLFGSTREEVNGLGFAKAAQLVVSQMKSWRPFDAYEFATGRSGVFAQVVCRRGEIAMSADRLTLNALRYRDSRDGLQVEERFAPEGWAEKRMKFDPPRHMTEYYSREGNIERCEWKNRKETVYDYFSAKGEVVLRIINDRETGPKVICPNAPWSP